MFGNLIFGATLIASASAHVALWDKGMFGYNYPKQATDSQDWNNNIPVEPLRQSDGLSVDQWFGHGYKGFPPKSGDFMILPAGGVYTGELNCNRAGTRMRDPARTDPLPTYACDGEGALHVMNRFNATVDPKWFGGTALAIAYTSDINALQPNDMTVISVNTQSPWFRETAYPIPAGLPPCPEGGCLCSWNWIHQANHGEGYGQEIYNLLYRCKVTGDTDSSATLSKPAIPKDCTGNPGACVKGPKTPMYVYQASGNNLPNLAVPPNYNDYWGFSNGAQNDIFAPTTTSPDYTSPTATSLPSGWSSMGCYVDQDPRSLPVFLFSRANNTIESCVSACATGGNSYAGVEGPECWCAKSIPTLVAAKASDCNKPCGGDTWATCGGDWRLNVYKTANAPSVATTVSPAATVVPTPISSAELPKGWTAVGCVIDQDYPRTLDAGAVSSDNTTIEGCIAIAQAKGLSYAGVQYGQECWVGTSASKANINLGTGCDVPCAGDRSTICGGSYRLNVFVNNALLGGDTSTSSAAPIVSASSTSSQTSSTSTAGPSATVPASSTTAVTTVSSATSTTQTSTTPIASTASSAAATSSSSSTLPAGWKDLGCQIDSSKPRLLSGFFVNNNKQNSAKYCISLCASKGFSYAGTEYGTQCFCGNSIKLKPASSADCSSKCASGDGKCGGVYRLNLYGVDDGSTVVQKKRDLTRRRSRWAGRHNDLMAIH